MPGDLFGTVAVRPPSVRSRRSPIFVVSLAIHVVVLLAVLIGTAVAPGVLPTPREALAFYQPLQMDIKLPPPPPAPKPLAPTASSAPSTSPNAAPLVPPTEIAPETPFEPVYSSSQDVIVGFSNDVGGNVGVLAQAPPLPVAPTPEQPRRLSNGITAPVKTVNVAPEYPDLARRAGVKGIVIIEAVIDASGIVTSARVLRGHPLLDQAAVDAVSRWKFTPARLNNEVIPVVMTVTVNFELN
jgi:protein TonB